MLHFLNLITLLWLCKRTAFIFRKYTLKDLRVKGLGVNYSQMVQGKKSMCVCCWGAGVNMAKCLQLVNLVKECLEFFTTILATFKFENIF